MTQEDCCQYTAAVVRKAVYSAIRQAIDNAPVARVTVVRTLCMMAAEQAAIVAKDQEK